MVHSKNKDYKFPGGGIKKGEGKIEALKGRLKKKQAMLQKELVNKLAWSLKEAKTNMFITEYLK